MDQITAVAAEPVGFEPAQDSQLLLALLTRLQLALEVLVPQLAQTSLHRQVQIPYLVPLPQLAVDAAVDIQVLRMVLATAALAVAHLLL